MENIIEDLLHNMNNKEEKKKIELLIELQVFVFRVEP